MMQLSSTFKLSATSLAASLMLAACGGGDAEPPPDMIPPTVVITDNVPLAVADGDVTFTFTFSESVGSSFDAGDVTVAGGTKGAFMMAADGLSATLVVSPLADSAGTITVQVPVGAFSDVAGNPSTVAFAAAQDYDTTIDVPPPPPPPPTGTVLASFDEMPPLAFEGFNGAESSSIAAGPEGGDGLAAKIVRLGGEAWAGAFVNVGPISLSATNNTISARVHSDRAGVPMVLKLENSADAGINTGDLQAQQTVVAGWQTLTWVVPAGKIGGNYDRVVMLPNLGTVASADPGETYYFDDITVVGAEPPPPPPTDGVVLASFDEMPALAFEGFNGAESSSIAAGPEGGDGLAAKIVRLGGEAWAGAFVDVGPISLSATANTISARVHSDRAGVPMVLKLENAADPGINTGDLQAQEQVVTGWQTLTWVVPANKISGAYNRVVMLPNLGTVASADPGETYYFDAITLIGGVAGGGGGGGGGVLSFSSGFGEGLRTVEGGEVGGFSGSNLDDFNCSGAPEFCGSGGEFSPAVSAADSFFFYYYQTPTPATALYTGIYLLAPGLTGGLSGSADAPGVTLNGQTRINFNLGQNAEWFQSGTNNFAVAMDLGKLYLVGGNPCRLQVRAIVSPVAAEVSSYSVPLSSFALVQDCAGVATTAAQAFALSPISQVTFQTNGGTIAFMGGGKTSGANLTVPVDGRYPTTIVLKGGVTFD